MSAEAKQGVIEVAGKHGGEYLRMLGGGSEVGLGAILVAWPLARHGLPVPLAIGLTVLAGVVIGLVVSLLIVRARIGSFIATLGMSSVLLAVIDWPITNWSSWWTPGSLPPTPCARQQR